MVDMLRLASTQVIGTLAASTAIAVNTGAAGANIDRKFLMKRIDIEFGLDSPGVQIGGGLFVGLAIGDLTVASIKSGLIDSNLMEATASLIEQQASMRRVLRQTLRHIEIQDAGESGHASMRMSIGGKTGIPIQENQGV